MKKMKMKTMTPQQVALVQTSFGSVLPIAGVAAGLFYTRLFDLDPSLRPLFKGDMREQGHKLMAALHLAVAGLDRPQELLPTVRALGRRHATYGVRPEHYDTVGSALLWTLEQGLGPAFTAPLKDAWAAAYALLAGAMLEAAGEAPARAPAEAPA